MSAVPSRGLFGRRPYDFAAPSTPTDMRRRAVRGTAVVVGGQAAKAGLHLAHTVVLARLLSLEDFGIVAMSVAVTGFIVQFREMGLPAATVQSPTLSREQANSMFWINLAASAVLAAVTVAMAPIVAWGYGEPRLTAVMTFSGACFVIGGLSMQHLALMRRQLRFKAITSLQVAGMVVGTATAIALGYLGFGYWALVVFPAVSNALVAVGAWWMSGWTPGRPRLAEGVGRMLLFGGNLTASNLVTYLSKNLDTVLIGWFWGAGSLGLYSKAYGLMLMPAMQLGRPVAATVVPTLSRLQGEPERLARYAYRGTHLTAAAMLPVVVVLAILAEPFIVLLLGEKWRPAADIFRMLAVVSLCQPLINLANWLMVSTGRADRLLRFALLHTGLMVVAFAVALPLGVWYVAVAHAVVNVGTLVPRLWMASAGASVTTRGVWGAVSGPVIASCVCGLACVAAWWSVSPSVGPELGAAAAAVAGGVAYLATLHVLGDLRQILVIARDLRSKPRQTAAPAPA